MEFCGGNAKRPGLQARIAWYNRPKDVMGGRSYDPRLLVATMHSDLNPVSSIRGKCTVTHKHYIPRGKLEQYKKQDNHFYYHQLYDRYMQRLYDVIPCELVQNVPTNVQEALYERYQFIVVEQGKASADLTVARRTCCVCHDWCARYIQSLFMMMIVCLKSDTLVQALSSVQHVRTTITCHASIHHCQENHPRALHGNVPFVHAKNFRMSTL